MLINVKPDPVTWTPLLLLARHVQFLYIAT
jgi:hypothetical protein